jgi:hypothetical protein
MGEQEQNQNKDPAPAGLLIVHSKRKILDYKNAWKIDWLNWLPSRKQLTQSLTKKLEQCLQANMDT